MQKEALKCPDLGDMLGGGDNLTLSISWAWYQMITGAESLSIAICWSAHRQLHLFCLFHTNEVLVSERLLTRYNPAPFIQYPKDP